MATTVHETLPLTHALPRPRRASALIDLSVQLMRRNYAALVTVATICCIPAVVAERLLLHTYPTPLLSWTISILSGHHKRPTGFANDPHYFFKSLIFILSSWLLYALMFAATTYIASDSYNGQPVNIRDVLRRAWPRTLSISVVAILKTLITLFCLLLFVVGALIPIAGFAVAGTVATLEQTNAHRALSRSAALTNELKWHALCTIGLGFLVTMLLEAVVTAFGFALGQLTHPLLWSGLSVVITRICITPLSCIIRTVLFYDLKIRNGDFETTHREEAQ